MSILSETNYQLTLSRAWSGITLWSKGGPLWPVWILAILKLLVGILKTKIDFHLTLLIFFCPCRVFKKEVFISNHRLQPIVFEVCGSNLRFKILTWVHLMMTFCKILSFLTKTWNLLPIKWLQLLSRQDISFHHGQYEIAC